MLNCVNFLLNTYNMFVYSVCLFLVFVNLYSQYIDLFIYYMYMPWSYAYYLQKSQLLIAQQPKTNSKPLALLYMRAIGPDLILCLSISTGLPSRCWRKASYVSDAYWNIAWSTMIYKYYSTSSHTHVCSISNSK